MDVLSRCNRSPTLALLSDQQFCFRACNPARRQAPTWCQHMRSTAHRTCPPTTTLESSTHSGPT
ncbi:uncharacterized protein BT62DRAFT_1074297 [Guyanagaster necrorhizus]|uniref:Uncharacterized protein n=1 Tax=Guyanagaster necrorhizus TaxID=856835 RepID=A0A9P8AUS0_9AGAR|nr:uncharacterized protein BT62DRAFT_1074297 [Guyanagaster necrorhizus MCA 3950]KAG7448758.1 hypothetical protein BT62DRAFT_1074297 [Guyanagaster necrorhizus MCA 3950]